MRLPFAGMLVVGLCGFSGVARAADEAPPAAPPTDAAAPAAASSAPAPAADTTTGAAAAPVAAEEERSAKNVIYAEGLGPGFFYSINYERTFDPVSARIGFGYVSFGASASATSSTGTTQTASASASFLTVPITVSYLGIGSKKHIFELGAGATILHISGSTSTFVDNAKASFTTVVPTILVGYRLQPPDGGFVFKVGMSPLIVMGGGGGVVPLPYLALGGVF